MCIETARFHNITHIFIACGHPFSAYVPKDLYFEDAPEIKWWILESLGTKTIRTFYLIDEEISPKIITKTKQQKQRISDK